MKIIDKNNIIKVTPLYPEINDELIERYKRLLNESQSLKDDIAELAMMKNLKEEDLISLNKKINDLSPLFHIEYGEKEIKEINNKVFSAIKNKSDARNIKE